MIHDYETWDLFDMMFVNGTKVINYVYQILQLCLHETLRVCACASTVPSTNFLIIQIKKFD